MEPQPRRRGRKARVFGERSSGRLEILLTPSEKAALHEIAADLDTPVATLVRDAVNEYVADVSERPKPFRRITSGSNSTRALS